MSIAVRVQVLHEAEDHIVNVRQTRRRVSWEGHEAEDNRNCPMGKISVPYVGDGRWMDLESVIQSEVSQKEKNKYSMLTHIHGI
uniref:Uncharacterized protein n=1 Tax=Balaenoptera musculus TaxID=9771 RepID=A0A8C0E462_BALMU